MPDKSMRRGFWIAHLFLSNTEVLEYCSTINYSFFINKVELLLSIQQTKSCLELQLKPGKYFIEVIREIVVGHEGII